MKTETAPPVYQIASTFYPSIGGAQRATETLSRALIRQGCPVGVLTRWYPGLKRREIIGDVPVRRLGFEGLGKLSSALFGLHTLYWVLRHGRGTPIIHTHSIDTPLLIGIALSLLARKRWVATVHGAPRIPEKRRSLLGWLRFHLLGRLVDHAVAISNAYEHALLDIGIPPERISLIPNGLDTDFFRPPQVEEREKLRSRHGCDSQTIVLLFLGRLIHRKRPDLLLRALAHLETNQKVKSLIVGDGPQMSNLQKIAQDLGIGTQVEFAGSVDNVRDFYWLSDIFVLPSRWEGLPVALLESMACGLTPLVSSCEGNLEVVTPERDGLSHAVDDLKSLKAQVERLVADAALRRRLGQEARRTIVESYGLDAVAESHLRIYEDLLEKGIQAPPQSKSSRGEL